MSRLFFFGGLALRACLQATRVLLWHCTMLGAAHPLGVTISRGALVMRRDVGSFLGSSRQLLSTVLAQDHFYSDFLSLHVTLLTPKSTRMMTQSCTSIGEGTLGYLPADLMTSGNCSILTGTPTGCPKFHDSKFGSPQDRNDE